MDFPEDKAFKQTEAIKKSRLAKYSRRLQWILVLAFLSFYFGYIGLLAVWWLLGAIINPNAFLPFASAALTFITFVRVKYKHFVTLAQDGRKIILSQLKLVLDSTISKVLRKLSENIEFGPLIQSKALLESEEFNKITSSLVSAGVITYDMIDKMKEDIEPNYDESARISPGSMSTIRSVVINLEKVIGELVCNKYNL